MYSVSLNQNANKQKKSFIAQKNISGASQQNSVTFKTKKQQQTWIAKKNSSKSPEARDHTSIWKDVI